MYTKVTNSGYTFVIKINLFYLYFLITFVNNTRFTNMKDRINTILQKYNMTSSDFADKIGVGKSNISHILGGRNNPSLEIVRKILSEFPEVNSEWLLFGTGSVTKSSEIIKPVIKVNKEPQLEFKDDEDIIENTPKMVEQIIDLDKEQINNQNRVSMNIDQDNDTDASEPIMSDIVPQRIKSVEFNKEVTKIVIYYSDNTYQQFDPNNLPL